MTAPVTALFDLALKELIRDGRIWDLSQDLHAGMPTHPNHPPFARTFHRRHGDRVRIDGYSAASDLVVLCSHHGTHVDAIGHVSVHGRLRGGADAQTAQRGPHGLDTLDVTEIAPLFARGLVLDVPATLGRDALEPGEEITVDTVEQTLARHGLTPRPGDVYLFRTGWGGRWGRPDDYFPQHRQPGPGRAVADWLIAHGAVMAAADTLDFEVVDGRRDEMPVHRALLFEGGVNIIENVNLEAVAAAGIAELVFVALPLRLRGATGSPIRAVGLT